MTESVVIVIAVGSVTGLGVAAAAAWYLLRRRRRERGRHR